MAWPPGWIYSGMMVFINVVLALLLGLVPAPAAEGVAREEFGARRAKLRESLRDGVTVLFGRGARDLDDSREDFAQEPNFYYFTGWREPGAVLLLSSSDEVLFLPRRDDRVERYTGHKTAAGDSDASAVTGFERVLPVEKLEAELAKQLETASRIYTLRAKPDALKLQALAPLREVRDAEAAITGLRLKKSAREIALIEQATAVSIEGHRAAWKRIAPGLREHQIAATMTAAFLDRGCRNAYAPIVASGPSATVLHYAQNSRLIGAGELVLMDVAADCQGYASDITRTVPASGKFTPRQRQIYDAVLGAEKAALAALKPGMIEGASRTAPNSLWKVAYDYLEARGLGKYLTHGVSHSVGLQVHDAPPSSYSTPLEEGMVITIEPGVYIPEENIGIRVEDLVLVTATGARVLSAALPTDPEAIERALAGR